MTLEEKLLAVQTELKSPKSARNTFGGYNYRSLEMILEAAKPLLKKYGLTLTISDDMVMLGDRYYVKATARITDPTDKNVGYIENTAYAREAVAKKGMDDSQITGTASSYARKYCLNGLFLIDDTKDADTDEYRTEASTRAEKDLQDAKRTNTRQKAQNSSETLTEAQIDNSNEMCNDIELATLESLCKKLKTTPEKVFKKWPNVTKKQYAMGVEELRSMIADGNKRNA